ncbi:unnamed protein product, partial [Laminaria digitata]
SSSTRHQQPASMMLGRNIATGSLAPKTFVLRTSTACQGRRIMRHSSSIHKDFLLIGGAGDTPPARSTATAENRGKTPPQGEFTRWRYAPMGSARAKKFLPTFFSPAGMTIRPFSAWATGDDRFCNRHSGETDRGRGVGAAGGGVGGGSSG